jgi:hypothetical protein
MGVALSMGRVGNLARHHQREFLWNSYAGRVFRLWRLDESRRPVASISTCPRHLVCAAPRPARATEDAMLDFFVLLIGVGTFALCCGYLVICERL